MFTRRRLGPLLLAICLTLVVIFTLRHRSIQTAWRQLPHTFGLGPQQPTKEEIASGKAVIIPNLKVGRPKIPLEEQELVFPAGKTKPAGSIYTRTLVVPRLSSENTSWIQEELGDIIAPNGPLEALVYVVDDRTAPLHTLKNKGHEVMVYLAYIIEHYDNLPDIAIFTHSHRFAWHNNELFDIDAAAMVRYLSPERVTREGYMNLRCHWDPGCPEGLFPENTNHNPDKQEEHVIAEYWPQLFPLDPVPKMLSQPCCAQFALSRERMLALPLTRYIYLRDWILRTELSDYISGRLFEYTWQFLFTGHSVECPDMFACYCDGYGICFEDRAKFDEWFESRYTLREYTFELKLWRDKQKLVEDAMTDVDARKPAAIDIPEPGRDEWLVGKIEAMRAELSAKRDQAFVRGGSPRVRAEAVGRPWQEGDGF